MRALTGVRLTAAALVLLAAHSFVQARYLYVLNAEAMGWISAADCS